MTKQKTRQSLHFSLGELGSVDTTALTKSLRERSDNFKNAIDEMDSAVRQQTKNRVNVLQESYVAIISMKTLHNDSASTLFVNVDAQKDRTASLHDAMVEARNVFRTAVKQSDSARFEYEATLLNANASSSADHLQRLELQFATTVNARYERDSAYQRVLTELNECLAKFYQTVRVCVRARLILVADKGRKRTIARDRDTAIGDDRALTGCDVVT
jgi:hypothetical protein